MAATEAMASAIDTVQAWRQIVDSAIETAIISTDPTDRRQLRELGRRIAAIARACKRTARSR